MEEGSKQALGVVCPMYDTRHGEVRGTQLLIASWYTTPHSSLASFGIDRHVACPQLLCIQVLRYA